MCCPTIPHDQRNATEMGPAGVSVEDSKGPSVLDYDHHTSLEQNKKTGCCLIVCVFHNIIYGF